jgi:uncharacterized damage-inducible protein DinB
MPEKQPWIERVFQFDFPVERYTELIQRLARTPDRLESLTGSLRVEQLVTRPEGGWSIQENVGHLLDLESLFMGRLDDFEAGLAELRPADMSNRSTEAAGHNDRDIGDLIDEFKQARARLVKRLLKLSPEAFARSAFHRRLDVQMRLVDMCYFQAEHDEHHMATIERLL